MVFILTSGEEPYQENRKGDQLLKMPISRPKEVNPKETGYERNPLNIVSGFMISQDLPDPPTDLSGRVACLAEQSVGPFCHELTLRRGLGQRILQGTSPNFFEQHLIGLGGQTG